MNTVGMGFPEPPQSVVNHAERFSIALGLAETDQSRAAAPHGLALSETWLVGRAGEVESLVGDVVHEWRAGLLTAKGAAAVIEFYLRAAHRGMRDSAGLGNPTCCSSAHECAPMDFATPPNLIARSYPCEALALHQAQTVVRSTEGCRPPNPRGPRAWVERSRFVSSYPPGLRQEDMTFRTVEARFLGERFSSNNCRQVPMGEGRAAMPCTF